MKFKNKKIVLLKALYENRFDGKYNDIIKILEKLEPTNYEEAHKISKSLKDEGYIEMSTTKRSIEAKIVSFGIEFIENIEEIDQKNISSDFFDKKERELIEAKLDEFSHRLSKIEIGQQVICDDFAEETESLKRLLNILEKKEWTQVLKGKLIDAGFGALMDSVGNLIIDTFKDKNLLK